MFQINDYMNNFATETHGIYSNKRRLRISAASELAPKLSFLQMWLLIKNHQNGWNETGIFLCQNTHVPSENICKFFI